MKYVIFGHIYHVEILQHHCLTFDTKAVLFISLPSAAYPVLLIATKIQQHREHILGRRFLMAMARNHSFTRCKVSYCPQIFFDVLAACLPLGCYFAPISEGKPGVLRMICPPWSFTLLPQRHFQL